MTVFRNVFFIGILLIQSAYSHDHNGLLLGEEESHYCLAPVLYTVPQIAPIEKGVLISWVFAQLCQSEIPDDGLVAGVRDDVPTMNYVEGASVDVLVTLCRGSSEILPVEAIFANNYISYRYFVFDPSSLDDEHPALAYDTVIIHQYI